MFPSNDRAVRYLVILTASVRRAFNNNIYKKELEGDGNKPEGIETFSKGSHESPGVQEEMCFAIFYQHFHKTIIEGLRLAHGTPILGERGSGRYSRWKRIRGKGRLSI